MRALRASNNVIIHSVCQRDGGFYPECLAVPSLHTHFRKAGPVGAEPPSSNSRVLNFAENFILGGLIQEADLFPMFGSKENFVSFVEAVRAVETSDACKLVRFSTRIIPAVFGTSCLSGSCFTKISARRLGIWL